MNLELCQIWNDIGAEAYLNHPTAFKVTASSHLPEPKGENSIVLKNILPKFR